MIGALLGLAGTVIGNQIANNKSEKLAKEAAKEREKQAAQARVSYWEQLGRSREMLQSGLNQAAETTAQQMQYIEGADAMMGGNGAKAAQMREQALQQKSAAERSALNAQLQSEQTAAQQRDVVLNDVSKQKVTSLEQQSQSVADAGSELTKTLMGLTASDLTSHLENGKGVLESAFAKKKTSGTGTGSNASKGFKVDPRILGGY